jgi:hypothetical protein
MAAGHRERQPTISHIGDWCNVTAISPALLADPKATTEIGDGVSFADAWQRLKTSPGARHNHITYLGVFESTWILAGAGCRNRTRDLLITNQLLYRLS